MPIKWLPEGKVSFLDQTLLPHEEVWIETSDYRVIAEAIRRLQVRGAPLIGIAAGYGLALAAGAGEPVETAAKELRSTRPTAVNLSWAIDRCLRAVDGVEEPREMRERLIKEAVSIHKEDVAANHRIGDYGAKLLSADDQSILTHCNAGTLATGGYGTALGVIRSASANGRLCSVIATETRPLLQGARLTAWELSRDRIPCTVIVDSAAGSYMRRGEIDAVIVGADRIAANGDVANKIGTYPLAVLARENGIPFYVAAPSSTADLSLASGDDIPIEQRSPDEVTSLRSEHIVTLGLSVQAENPAFDVTPSRYVTAIITENGVAKPPFEESLERLCARSSGPRRTARPATLLSLGCLTAAASRFCQGTASATDSFLPSFPCALTYTRSSSSASSSSSLSAPWAACERRSSPCTSSCPTSSSTVRAAAPPLSSAKASSPISVLRTPFARDYARLWLAVRTKRAPRCIARAHWL